MPYIPPGFVKNQPPVPPGWTFDDWMQAGTQPPDTGEPEPEPKVTYGPFTTKDVRYWIRGTRAAAEIGFNIDDDSEADLWVDVEDADELEGPALTAIKRKIAEKLS